MADLMNDPWVVPVTTDFAYVRFIGVHEQYAEYHHEQVDVTDRLRWWRSEFDHLAPLPETTYAVFGNDYSGYAVGSANRFRRVLGLPVHAPSPGDKGELFG